MSMGRKSHAHLHSDRGRRNADRHRLQQGPREGPELASAAMHRVQQLAAVIVVPTTGIEKTIEASASGSKRRPLYASPYGARRSWQDLDLNWDKS